jgi:hypothetical protein
LNCTICKKPIEEHGEGLSTDMCIATKLGLDVIGNSGRFRDPKDRHITSIPHYSSPEMNSDVWGLVESKKASMHIGTSASVGDWGVHLYHPDGHFIGIIKAPTPTLAICRAFLVLEETNEERI